MLNGLNIVIFLYAIGSDIGSRVTQSVAKEIMTKP